MRTVTRMMLRSSGANRRHDEPDDDRYIATSLVDDLLADRKWTFALFFLIDLLFTAVAAFCLKDITRAQIEGILVAAVGMNGLATIFHRAYILSTLHYLCWYQPDSVLENLSGAEILSRYQRGRAAGALSAALYFGTVALLAWMETRLYCPDILRMPLIPMTLLAMAGVVYLVQAVRVLLAARNIRRTSKWWAEERADGSTVSFAEYAHTPIE